MTHFRDCYCPYFIFKLQISLLKCKSYLNIIYRTEKKKTIFIYTTLFLMSFHSKVGSSCYNLLSSGHLWWWNLSVCPSFSISMWWRSLDWNRKNILQLQRWWNDIWLSQVQEEALYTDQLDENTFSSLTYIYQNLKCF